MGQQQLSSTVGPCAAGNGEGFEMPGIDRGPGRPVEPTELFDARSGGQELESKWFGFRRAQSRNSSDTHGKCTGSQHGTDGNQTTDIVVHEPERPRVGP